MVNHVFVVLFLTAYTLGTSGTTVDVVLPAATTVDIIDEEKRMPEEVLLLRSCSAFSYSCLGTPGQRAGQRHDTTYTARYSEQPTVTVVSVF